MQVIDAHQHFWDPARGDYGWMPADDAVLSRPYGPADLVPQLDACGVTATILVQAEPTVAETEYLLGLAEACDRVAGVVGWVDFDDPSDRATLERLARHPKFLGVRPMIQDIPDPDWMLRDAVQWGFRAVTDLGLTFDALGFPRHLENFARLLLDRHPEMPAVIDHAMKPALREDDPSGVRTWADGLARLASRPGIACKLSGLVTEDGPDWTADRLAPAVNHILGSFGPARVMWGSDWPVCRLRAEYADWFDTARALTAHLPEEAQEEVFGGTARRFYRLRD